MLRIFFSFIVDVLRREHPLREPDPIVEEHLEMLQEFMDDEEADVEEADLVDQQLGDVEEADLVDQQLGDVEEADHVDQELGDVEEADLVDQQLGDLEEADLVDQQLDHYQEVRHPHDRQLGAVVVEEAEVVDHFQEEVGDLLPDDDDQEVFYDAVNYDDGDGQEDIGEQDVGDQSDDEDRDPVHLQQGI